MIWPDDVPARIALTVAVIGAVTAGVLVASPLPDTADDHVASRTAYAAGWRHAQAQQGDPRPSGFPAWPYGTLAACSAWIDQTDRGLDRTSFLAGCADATLPPETP